MITPNRPRQYSVLRAIVSCSHVNADAPTTGPASVCTPPSSTMTSASTDLVTDSASGAMLPLENTNSAPASLANRPAITNAAHCTRRTSMPMASARKAESRPARSAKPSGENSMRRSR